MAKWVPVQPSSAARAFISLTNASIEPEICTAMILQASFALLSMAQYRRSRRDMVSPTFMLSVLPSSTMPSSASSPAVTESSSEASPRSTASTASRTVMIFVSEAGARCSSAL